MKGPLGFIALLTIVFVLFQITSNAAWKRGFADGQGEAYSHIDDNKCKPVRGEDQ